MPTWQAAWRGVIPSVSRKFTFGLSVSNRAISSASPFRAATVSRRPQAAERRPTGAGTSGCTRLSPASSSGSLAAGTSETAQLASEPTSGLGLGAACAGASSAKSIMASYSAGVMLPIEARAASRPASRLPIRGMP
eukprot:scaffold99194_cov51-Phaeocystis_antarctica.AAC.2